MARGINKVILVGNLGQDPELRYTSDGSAVCNATLATNGGYTGADGVFVEQTEWHRLVFWNRLAEVVGEYLKKGSQVYVEGELRTRKWTDRDGIDRYTTEIKCYQMMMLDRAPSHTNGQAQAEPQEAEAEFTTDDDLPF